MLARIVLYVVGLTTSLCLSWIYLFDYFSLNETAVILWGGVDLVLTALLLLFSRYQQSFKVLLTHSLTLLVKSFFQILPMLLWLFLHDITLYNETGQMFKIQWNFAIPHIIVIVCMLSLLYIALYPNKQSSNTTLEPTYSEGSTDHL